MVLIGMEIMVLLFGKEEKGYDSRIAGIGYDSNTNLDQRQSVSQDGLIEIYHGAITNDFPLENRLNPNFFPADLSFLVWGDNGEDIDALSKKVKNGADNSINRIWKVSKIGSIDTITLRFPKAAFPDQIRSLYVNNHEEKDFPANANTKVYSLEDDGTYLFTKLVLNDGDIFTFGDGIENSAPTDSFPLAIHLFPNPAKNQTSLSIKSIKTQELQINVLNAAGQLVFHFRKQDPTTFEMIDLPASRWAAGLYFVKVSNGRETRTAKLIVSE